MGELYKFTVRVPNKEASTEKCLIMIDNLNESAGSQNLPRLNNLLVSVLSVI